MDVGQSYETNPIQHSPSDEFVILPTIESKSPSHNDIDLTCNSPSWGNSIDEEQRRQKSHSLPPNLNLQRCISYDVPLEERCSLLGFRSRGGDAVVVDGEDVVVHLSDFGFKQEARIQEGEIQTDRKIRSLSSDHEYLQIPKTRMKLLGNKRTKVKPTLKSPVFSRSRIRSASPDPAKNSHSPATSPDCPKSPWPRLRFRVRKTPISVPGTAMNTSSTSDPQEAAEMLLSQNPPVETQNSQPDAMVTDSPLNSGHFMSNTAGFSGNGLGNDVPDSLPVNDVQRTKLAVTHLQQKILKISEQIKIEQNSRDDNVAEYLKLAKDADKQQAARIKSVFEKKNQKSKATIAQLQKKLENYHKRLKEIENSGSSKNQPRYLKDGLKDLRDFSGGVVDSVKGGLSGLSQVTQTAAGAIVSKPKEMASKIKNKFGSADNISSLKDDEDSGGNIRFGSADDVSVATSAGSADYLDTQAVPSNQLSLISTVTTLKSQMSSLRQDCANFSDFRDNLRAENSILQEELEKFKLLPRNIDMLTNSLQDERYRCSRLEDQLHDLSEMHHRELSDLKQEISSLEEKFEYHALERARDIQEALEACQTRISKMEVQQQHQHQQLVTMEGVENANARALLGKLINLLLSVLAVILVFVSTASSIVRPVVRTQTRMAITLVCVVCLVLLYRNLDALTKYWSNR